MSINKLSREELIKMIVQQNTLITNMSKQMSEIIDLSNMNLTNKSSVEKKCEYYSHKKKYLIKMLFILFVLLIIVILWLIFSFNK